MKILSHADILYSTDENGNLCKEEGKTLEQIIDALHSEYSEDLSGFVSELLEIPEIMPSRLEDLIRQRYHIDDVAEHYVTAIYKIAEQHQRIKELKKLLKEIKTELNKII